MRSLFLTALLLGCGYPEYKYTDDPTVPGADADPDSTSTTDSGIPGCPRPNGCGGCEDQGVKGARCEPCGQWTCDGTKVVCTPASPAPGGSCGICMTSKLECTATGTTACVLADDRITHEDANFKSKDDRVTVVDRTKEALISFKSVRTMAYVDISTVMKRIPYVCAKTTALPHPDSACSNCMPAVTGGGFDCTVPSPAGGFITMTLYAGMPPSLVPLAMASGPATTVFDSKTEWVTIDLDSPVSPRPVGTQLSVGITTDSTAFAFEIYGGGTAAFPPAATDTKWWSRLLKPMGPWNEQLSTDIAHVLRGKSCAP